MKKLMFITLLFTVKSYSQTQTLPMVEGKVDYIEVVKLDSSYKKNDLYLNAKKFFVDFFVSGKDVVQMDDKDAGIVIGKGNLLVSYKANFAMTYKTRVSHTIKLSLKDGKYKYEITDLSFEIILPSGNHVAGNESGTIEDFPKHNKDKFYSDLQDEIKDEITKLKTYMAKKQSTADF